MIRTRPWSLIETVAVINYSGIHLVRVSSARDPSKDRSTFAVNLI